MIDLDTFVGLALGLVVYGGLVLIVGLPLFILSRKYNFRLALGVVGIACGVFVAAWGLSLKLLTGARDGWEVLGCLTLCLLGAIILLGGILMFKAGKKKLN